MPRNETSSGKRSGMPVAGSKPNGKPAKVSHRTIRDGQVRKGGSLLSRSVVIKSARPAVLDAVRDFASTVEQELESDETIVNALALFSTSPATAHLEQLRATADLRARFMREVPALKSADLSGTPASAARTPSAKAHRWKLERRVFSVTFGGFELYPLFQFAADGQPLPVMRQILEIFNGLSDWQIALWFFAPNSWLANEPPMNVLQSDAEAVVRAARQAIEPIEV